MGVIMHNNISYGGGSSIEPNPQESATEQLETLGIGGDVYEVTDANAAREVQETITEAQSRANLADGDSVPTIFGKIKKFFSDLKTVAFTGAYSDLSGTPTIPTVNNGTLTIKQNNTNLGTFTANQSTASNINIECAVPSDVEGSKVVTGNPLTITDAAGIKAEKIEIGFEPKQDKHEYDSVWVGGAGKNKLQCGFTDGSSSGMSWTKNLDSDGNVISVTLNGTYSSSSRYFLKLMDIYLEAGSYYLSGAYNAYAELDIEGGLRVTNNNPTVSTAFTVSTAGTYPVYIAITQNQQLTNAKLYPMIRSASETDATFAPYSNKASLTGYTSLSADGCGKNLINPAKITESANHVNGYVYSDGDGLLVDAGPYTLSVSQQCNGLYVSEAVEGASSIAYVNNSDVLTFTIPNKMYIKMQSWRNSGVTGMTYQLEKGNQATTYEAYKPKNVTVQFNQTLYGGKLTILQDGSADIECDRAFSTINGSEGITWTINNTSASYQLVYANTRTYLPGCLTSGAYDQKVVFNMFNTQTTTTKAIDNAYLDQGYINMVLSPNTFANSAAVNTFLASNNLQVAYSLKDPFTIHLSPVEALTLLQGINNVWTDGTTLSLTYQPDNAIGQAKGTAQELADSASTWKLFAESANANIPLPTNCKELYICVIYVTGNTSAIMYNFHILPDILTKATSYFRQGDYYTPDYFCRCEIRIRKTSNVYDTRVECLYMNNTTDRSANTKVKVYYR